MIKIKKNSKMKYLNSKILNDNIKYNDLLKDIKLIKIKDSIIVDQNLDIKKANEFYDKSLNLLGGKIGYETSRNEIFISAYMSSKMTVQDGIYIAVDLVKILDKKIRMINPDISECYILSVDEDSGNIYLTFHEIINGELWVDSNLENYRQPIAVFISNIHMV